MIKRHCLLSAFALSSIAALSFHVNAASPDDIQQALQQVYAQYKTNQDGNVADYIPELKKVNPALFAIAIVTTDGRHYTIGNTEVSFPIESISKSFVYALALEDNGEPLLQKLVGLNATGHRFNSILAIEERPDHLQNPLVNAGALQVTSIIKGKTSTEKWQRVLQFINQLGEQHAYLGESVYRSEMATNQRNRAIALLLNAYGMITNDPLDAIDRYTKACSLMTTIDELAMMGATLANHGIHPITHQPLISAQTAKNVLAEMIVNGLYENSGAWFVTVGVPAKSGVSGVMLAVVPNKMAIAVFSPRLDEAGNSVRAQLVIKALAKRWHLHLLP